MHVRFAVAFLLASAVLAGCATAIKTPCEFDVHVRVTDKADAECKKLDDLTDDEGHPITWRDHVNGCADHDSKRIITDAAPATWAHEVGHFVKWICGAQEAL